MKANSTKRKIFDAVDLLTEDTSSQMPVKTMKGGVTMLDIDSIKPFHNHPFHLYEGDRLDDMVESIRDHGILNPVIVREIDDGYEMLSGHNRQKAAKIAGLKKIPAIIKYDLPDTDAYVYVIETNLMQRSFSDLEISEKAAVLKERYDKVLYQRQRESIDFDMVVIDELSSFKNWQAKRFKSFMKVRPMVKRVVGLTGTPSSNGLMDLFAEFKVLDMGERLGRFIGQYRVNYFKPDRMNGPIVYTYKLLPGAEDRIYDKISDITISMKGTDYLEMPELISTEYKVYLDDTEKAKYEALRDEFVLQLPGGEITASNAATLSGKLSQLANGAIYSDDGDVNIFHERKLDALEDLIEAANGKPVLVAYWFKHDLRRISERLSNLGIDYQQLDSDASIKKWNAGQLQVGLIHPASAGHGLNLQSGGNILVWFGITWSLELYQQTVARLWRQGQTEGTVSVIHIVTDGTVDERILKALEAKDLTQSALIDAVKAEVGDGK